MPKTLGVAAMVAASAAIVVSIATTKPGRSRTMEALRGSLGETFGPAPTRLRTAAREG